jgi:tRNA nucleotidyltransferase (CCA-adding enzyme)
MSKVENLLQQHPEWPAVESIYHKLRENGYKAFLAGGCVRDALLGVFANDLDIATDATPDQIEALFPKTVNVGKSFGVMRVLEKDEDIEVATFRTDGSYADGRRPDSVMFSSPEEDAKRRDFTINSLFFDLENKTVLDFVDGQPDLENKIIRTVGDPEQRFTEDHLRLLRAVRFVAQLDFIIEEETFKCITKMSSLVKSVSGERLRDEWIKLLKSKHAAKGIKAAADTGLMRHLFPFHSNDLHWEEKEHSQDWHLLALFLRTANQSALQSSLDMLKLSTKERRHIEDAWATWHDPQGVLGLRWGEQLQRLARPGVLYAFRIFETEKNELKLANILLAWQALDEKLPPPLLTGEDVHGLKGPDIGRCLQEAYNLQLEEQIPDREKALEWLAKYLASHK